MGKEDIIKWNKSVEVFYLRLALIKIPNVDFYLKIIETIVSKVGSTYHAI